MISCAKALFFFTAMHVVLFLFFTQAPAEEKKIEALGGDIYFKGNVGINYKWYLQKPETKRSYNLAGTGEVEATYEKDDFFAKVLIAGLYDTHEEERNFLRANEAYLRYDFQEQEATVTAGRQILFWGALEVYNPVDIINTQDLAYDPFNIYKIGANLFSFGKFFENSGLELIAKFIEQDQPFPGPQSPYFIFPPFLVYDEKLITEESDARPTLYLKYSGSTDTKYPIDYAVVLSNGYDKQRLITLTGPNKLQQNAYIASKIMTFDTIVIDATLVKVEASYTDIKDNTVLSDYFQLGAGVEHTLEQIYRGWDLGLISEYYLYRITDKTKFDDLRLFQPFQNDLFLGFRLTFNDVGSSEIVGGGIIDMEYRDEMSLYAKFKTRVFDNIIIEADIRKIIPNNENAPTLFKLIDDHLRVTFNFFYYF